MHLSDKISKSSIRLCFSKFNTLEDPIKAAELIYTKYKSL